MGRAADETAYITFEELCDRVCLTRLAHELALLLPMKKQSLFTLLSALKLTNAEDYLQISSHFYSVCARYSSRKHYNEDPGMTGS